MPTIGWRLMRRYLRRQLPDSRTATACSPSLGLSVNGQSAFPSQDLNENQREITHCDALELSALRGCA